MIAELGHYALVLALGLALVQAAVPFWGAKTRDPVLMALAGPTAIAQFVFVAAAFLALVWCHVASDFSILTVFENSHSAKPLIYKITGVWGNHEGSMLLWILMLALFGALVAGFGTNLPATLKSTALAVQAWIAAAFELFVLATSNPFVRFAQPPLEGRDLNPILQDPGLAVHPPLLYLGYVGFSITFSFAAAALIEGRIDAAWARWVLPWLAGTALLHSAVVMEKRDALKVWTILLAVLTFSLSLVGTFLVRSGVLTSVHTFANDPARGVFLLLILALFIGGSLALFAWRAPLLKQGGLFAPISRESALLFNNLFLATACATVFVGTLYPLVLEALTGDKISVGAPFFNLTFGPMFVPLLMAVPLRPLLAWKRGDLYGVAQRLLAAGGVAAVGLAATFAFAGTKAVFAPFGIGLALFVMAGAITDIAERIDLRSMSLETIGRRAAGLPRSAWGTAVAHFALGITLLGIVCETNWSSERIVALKPTQTVSISGYDLSFDGMVSRDGSNYRETAARFTVRKAGAVIGVMEPSKRTFPSRDGMSTTEAALLTRGSSQLYLSLGDNNADGSIAMRLYYKPFVLLIWLGALVMAFGGALSLSDRRLRIGAPKPAARILAQPAE